MATNEPLPFDASVIAAIQQDESVRVETAPSPRVRLHRTTRNNRSSTRQRRQPEDAKHAADTPIEYEVYTADHPKVINGEREADNMMVAMLKQEINAAGISRRDMYAYIGAGPEALFTNENQVYNLEYGMRSRPTISIESVEKWMVILNKRLCISFEDIPEDAPNAQTNT